MIFFAPISDVCSTVMDFFLPACRGFLSSSIAFFHFKWVCSKNIFSTARETLFISRSQSSYVCVNSRRYLRNSPGHKPSSPDADSFSWRQLFQRFSYLKIRACIWSSMASWFLTIAQFATGRSFHFFFSSRTRRYKALNTESSLGNEPFLVTLRKLELTDSTAFVVYITFLTALP